MKSLKIALIIPISILLFNCGNNTTNNTPSIKENSTHAVKDVVVDYSNIPEGKLLKHVQAHLDLGQLKEGKDKLLYLIKQFPDSLNGVDLIALKNNFDIELEAVEKKNLAIAEAEVLKRMPEAINKMRIIKEGENIFYYDLSSPEFNTKECFYAYIKKGVYGPQLRFKARYVGTQWVNIENVIVTIDNLDHTFNGKVEKTETKGKKAYKMELFDIPVDTDTEVNTLKAIANANEVVALYVGPESYKKRDISKKQKIAIRNVLDAFEYLKKTGNKKKEYYTNVNE